MRTRTTLYKGGPIPKSPGRPKGGKSPVHKAIELDLRTEARKLTGLALATLKRNLKCGTPSAEIHAADSLMDRGHGKPTQPISGANGGPIVLSFADVLGKINGQSGPEQL